MVLTYTFLKPYISKICNDFSFYIFIYIYDGGLNQVPFVHDGHLCQTTSRLVHEKGSPNKKYHG